MIAKMNILKVYLLSCFRIWCRAIEKMIPDVNICKWGWKKEGEIVAPLWMTPPEASQACKELINCGCKTKCGSHCKCQKADLSCTELCNCDGC